MKNIFTLLAMLFTVITVNAATYPIYVKGIQVTDANKSDVLGDGKVKYQNSNNMLIFSNAYISCNSTAITVTEEMTENLEMNFEGNNTIISVEGYGIKYNGKGKLTLWSNEIDKGYLYLRAVKSGFNALDIAGNSNLRINKLRLVAEAGSTAIGTHLKPVNENLEIANSDVKLFGDVSAVKFKSITLTGCDYKDGYGINGFNSEGRGTYNNTVMQDVRILAKANGLKVMDEYVSTMNQDNILGDNSKSLKYDYSKNELTLNNATLTVNDIEDIIYTPDNYDSPLNIKLVGTSRITVESSTKEALHFGTSNHPVTIYSSTGTGILEVLTHTNKPSVYTGTDITFKDCTVRIKNTSTVPVACAANDIAVYNFNNVNFSAETNAYNVLQSVKGLRFTNCFIQTPSDGLLTNLHNLGSAIDTRKLVIVPGKDNIKPNFMYGETMEASDITAYSANISFYIALDNLTESDNIKYHAYVAKNEITGIWNQDFDINFDYLTFQRKVAIKNLEPNTKYFVRIKVTDEAGNYNFYKDLSFTTEQNNAPTLPQNRKISNTATSNSISLNWNAASDDWTATNELEYTVEYKVKGSSGWFMPSNGNATSYVIQNLKPNTTYLVDVKVEDESKKYSRYGEIEVTTLTGSAVESITADETANAKTYNLQGVEVDKNYKGIVIINGKKQIRK